MKSGLIILFSLLANVSFAFPENPDLFTLEASGRFHPWSDDFFCSRAEYAILEKAKTKCSPYEYQQVTEFKQSHKGAVCTLRAVFRCLKDENHPQP